MSVGREAGGILVQVRVGEESCIYMLAVVGERFVTAGHVVTSDVVAHCVAELGIAEMSCRVCQTSEGCVWLKMLLSSITSRRTALRKRVFASMGNASLQR